jgi:hypothetical protein
MGSLFLATYTLGLGDPVPHHIDAAVVGDPQTKPATVKAVQGVAQNSLEFTRYSSTAAALHAIDLQRVYAALDLTSPRPTLYLASAAGASVARVLQKATLADPRLRVVDTHSLAPTDPSGLDIFYLMLVATIIGFLTVFQTRANAAGLPLRHWTAFVVAFALTASLVLTLVEGPILNRLDIPLPEVWGILALHILAVASFASVMTVLLGRWAILPTWLFFVVLGNSSSGGAVSPPLLGTVRIHLAVASVGGDRHLTARRHLLRRLSARAADPRACRVGHGALHGDACHFVPASRQPRGSLSGG